MHPGSVQFRRSQTPTLLQALAGAGGPTDRASKKVILKRMVDGDEKTSTTIQEDHRRTAERRRAARQRPINFEESLF